jgi:hypothetical protein
MLVAVLFRQYDVLVSITNWHLLILLSSGSL